MPAVSTRRSLYIQSSWTLPKFIPPQDGLGVIGSVPGVGTVNILNIAPFVEMFSYFKRTPSANAGRPANGASGNPGGGDPYRAMGGCGMRGGCSDAVKCVWTDPAQVLMIC